MTHVTANTTNAGFRLYQDDVAGAITAQTPLAAANVNATIDTGTKFHAVLRWNENAGADASVAARLEYNLAGGGWNDVTTTTPIQSVAPTNCTTANGAQYATNAAGLQNGTTVERGIYNSGGADVTANTLNNSSDEAAFCLLIDNGQVSDGQALQLRVSDAGTALNADTTLVTITVNVPAVTHATTGALVGQGAAVAGSANRTSPAVTHATTGTLIGQGSAVAGSATRFRAFSTSGALQGQGADVTGAAARLRAFDASGALVGQGSNVTGSAIRFRAFDTSGALVGGGASVSGSAERVGGAVTHDTSGALSAGTATVAGSATRFRAFSTSGALAGGTATITGDAQRSNGPVTHDTSSALVGGGSVASGTSVRFRSHTSTGTLLGGGAALSGAASRTPSGPVTHNAAGALVGVGALLTGLADMEARNPRWWKIFRGKRPARG